VGIRKRIGTPMLQYLLVTVRYFKYTFGYAQRNIYALIVAMWQWPEAGHGLRADWSCAYVFLSVIGTHRRLAMDISVNIPLTWRFSIWINTVRSSESFPQFVRPLRRKGPDLAAHRCARSPQTIAPCVCVYTGYVYTHKLICKFSFRYVIHLVVIEN
jgi:hypothetical protein